MRLDETVTRALRRGSDELALEYDGQWYSWAWIAGVARQVEQLLTDAGLPENTPVGLIARNRPSFVAAMLSVVASRRSVVMVYAFQSAEALAADVRRLRLPVIIADRQDWTDAVLQAAGESGTLGIALGGPVSDHVEVIARPHNAEGSEVRGPVAELAVEMLTSGTTGEPKRMPLSFDFIARAMIGESTQAVAPVVSPGATVAVPAQPPALVMFPFGNISGLYSYFPMMASGRPVVLMEKFTVKGWVDFVRKYAPKQINLPPAGVRMVLDAKIPAADLASLEFVFSGASWLDPNTQAEFRAVYGTPILLSYGATEFGGPVTAMTSDLLREFGEGKLESVGRPWAGTTLRIVDADSGAELAPGEMGVLELRAPRLGPDWVRTTDLAVIDTDGFMFHRGRADGAIMRGGYKILPEVVAAKMALHPSVAAVSVVGLSDARLGQVPVAAIELKPGAETPSAEELEAHARKHLYATHIPAAFRIVDALPRTPSLKISLPGVKRLFEVEGSDRSTPKS